MNIFESVTDDLDGSTLLYLKLEENYDNQLYRVYFCIVNSVMMQASPYIRGPTILAEDLGVDNYVAYIKPNIDVIVTSHL